VTVKITLIVETTNHSNRIEFTETREDSNANPRYDGDNILRLVPVMTQHIVNQIDDMTPSPIRTGDR